MTAFAQLIVEKTAEYVQFRRGFGLVFTTQAGLLASFQRFVDATDHDGPLTQHLIVDYLARRAVTTRTQAKRYAVLRHFAQYLAVQDPQTEVPDPHGVPSSRVQPQPRVPDDEELDQLLRAAHVISSRHPFRGETLYTMLGLMASAGLRSGEVRRLDRDDVDLQTGILLVRQSKFRKDRLVPVHASTQAVLRTYASLRDQIGPRAVSPAFFVNLRGHRLSPSCFGGAFVEARARAGAGLRPGRPLRPHDLRHRFATRRMMAWHQEGANVQALLPVLATYLGHARYSDTAYYIHATPELLAAAADRYFQSLARPDGGRA